jgi:hypothetical protein
MSDSSEMNRMDQEKKKEFTDALNTYYKLKDTYENSYKKDKNKIIKTKGLSWKEKRIEYTKLKPKCINCKRPVGTFFSTVAKNSERTLVAKCGDKKNPCSLNIVINLGYIINLSTQLTNDEKKIAQIKKDIIIDKNKLLFGYLSSKDAVEKFDEVKESFSGISINYEYSLNSYTDIIDNKEKKEELQKEEAEAQLIIGNMKKMISEFEKSNDVQFVNDAVEVYVKEMVPLLDIIMKKKYAYSGVDYDEDTNMYKLIQVPFSIEKLEWDLAENSQGVVSLKMGMDRQVDKSRAKTVRASKFVKPLGEMKIVIPKKQTKKIRKPVLMLDSDSNPELEKGLEEKKEKVQEEEEEKVPFPNESDSDSDSDQDVNRDANAYPGNNSDDEYEI